MIFSYLISTCRGWAQEDISGVFVGELLSRYVFEACASFLPYPVPLKISELTRHGSLDYVLTGISVLGFPAPDPPPMAHFSAADFFRDCPWLNVPSHRKADIMVEPLYPRLGLLGGAPEAGGKPSKLAQLAAARKKKEAESAAAASRVPSGAQSQQQDSSVPEPKAAPLSLSERLAKAKAAKSSEPSAGLAGLRRPVKPSPSASQSSVRKSSETESEKAASISGSERTEQKEGPDREAESQPAIPVIRAAPSNFASIIVGSPTGPTMAEPSHFDSNGVDLLKIYGQDHAEPFDFAGPSPDDVVLNAQNTAKGLAIRKKTLDISPNNMQE